MKRRGLRNCKDLPTESFFESAIISCSWITLHVFEAIRQVLEMTLPKKDKIANAERCNASNPYQTEEDYSDAGNANPILFTPLTSNSLLEY